MKLDNDLIQLLNLLQMSNDFVLHEIGENGEVEVVNPSEVPANTGVYWVYARIILKSQKHIDGVFRLDTDSGGSHLEVFWSVKDQWFRQDDSDLLSALGGNRADIFPYDWKYGVPLEEDLYHG